MANLERQGFECYLPRIRLQKIYRKQQKIIAEPLFARYLFIRLDDSGEGLSWSPIRSTPGVSQLVRFGNHPAQVSDALIRLLREREAAQQATPLFEPGDCVTIVDGPLAGMQAIYRTNDGEQRAIILLQLLNRAVDVKLDITQLRRQ